jgi:hypothetical protein
MKTKELMFEHLQKSVARARNALKTQAMTGKRVEHEALRLRAFPSAIRDRAVA